jgi:hypothetical protein
MPRLVVSALVSVAVLAAGLVTPAAAAPWTRPVRGAVARGFDVHGSPFAHGLHRGVDLAAAPGAVVRAACGGRIVVARRIGTSGGVVTIECGRWRVSHLPLGRIAVRRGGRVSPGDALGLAGRSGLHAGLHLGVRAARRRFGYVDPLRFLGRRPTGPPPAGPRGGTGERRSREQRAPAASPVASPAPQPAVRPLAPWPAWAGAALALAGTAGGGVQMRRVRERRRAIGLPSVPGEGVR